MNEYSKNIREECIGSIEEKTYPKNQTCVHANSRVHQGMYDRQATTVIIIIIISITTTIELE